MALVALRSADTQSANICQCPADEYQSYPADSGIINLQ